MRLRRPLLAILAAATLAAPAISSGCGASFDPISKIEGLRVLGVVADHPYATAGGEVNFKMSLEDVDPNDPDGPERNIEITWLGGCFDPDGDDYFGCYNSIASTFQGALAGDPTALGYVQQAVNLDAFSLKIPDDIVTRRPKPTSGPYYGIAFVFFAACAGHIQPIGAEGSGKAGSFPLGCFDEHGNRLGADSFVPGYTEVFVFDDGRMNNNPSIDTVLVDNQPVDDPNQDVPVPRCAVDETTRQEPPGCGRPDPTQECTEVNLDIKVPADVADIDPDATSADGTPLHEAVWADYYVDAGDLGSDVALIVDPTTGETTDHSVSYLPPPDPGRVNLWIVLHDARGGAAVTHRSFLVQ